MEEREPLDRSEQAALLAIFQAFLQLPNAGSLQLYFYADTSGGLRKASTSGIDDIVLHWYDMGAGIDYIEGYKQELQGEISDE